MPRTLADRFYAEREANPRTLTTLVRAAEQNYLPRRVARWLEREVLPGRPDGHFQYFYRGHADCRWGLSSTLYRTMPRSRRVTEKDLENAESAVIRVMREQGLGHLMNDGELLMVLQHHQIPTRLIDVCRDPLPALFFATEGDDSQDGRMFMIGQRVDPVTGQHPKLILGGYSDLPWSGAARGSTQATTEWSNTVAVVADEALDPRMRAQSGCFLVGGLIRRYGGENLTVGDEFLPAGRWQQITTLACTFRFPEQRSQPPLGGPQSDGAFGSQRPGNPV